MTFIELIELMRNRGISSLADIARELDVSPQSVSNWKARDQVPYKYVVYIQNKYNLDKDMVYSDVVDTHDRLESSTANNNKDKLSIYKDDEIDPRALFQLLWNDRKRIIQITVFVTLLGIIYALLETDLYKSTISIYPSFSESSATLSDLQGVAASFGVDVGGRQTAFHIPDIVESLNLKTNIVKRKWECIDYEKPVDLISYWELNVEGISLNPINWIKSFISIFNYEEVDQYPKWLDKALNKLVERITVNEKKSGLVVVNVWMEEPKLASDISNYIYEAIVNYTVMVHNVQAKLNKEFIEGRRIEVQKTLTQLEDRLEEFRVRNRNISESPELQMDLERYMRDVQIQTQVYITLQQQYELARIEEVKETPSVVILDEGKPAVEKDKPKRKLIVLIFSLLGGMIAIVFTLLKKVLINKV